MPIAFENCIDNGGRVRTIKLPKGKYMRICYPKGGGSPVHGEVKTPQHKLDVYSEFKLTQKNMPMVSDLLEMMDRLDLRIYKSKYYGQTNGRYIKTNTKKGGVLNTIVHELMHIKYPEKSEEEIQKVSAQVEGSLSMRDQARLLTEYESGISRVSDRQLMYAKKTPKAMIKRMGFKS